MHAVAAHNDSRDTGVESFVRSLAEARDRLPEDENELRAEAAHAESQLRGKLSWEIRSGCRSPWLVILAGGTNVGKSEIFNALVGEEKALPDARGAQTKHPLAFVHRDDLDDLGSMLAPAWDVRSLKNPLDLNAREGAEQRRLYLLEHERDDLRGFCLLDSPDIDSDFATNRIKALELAVACDALLFVTVAEKYNDGICVGFLKDSLREVRRVRLIFNLATDDNLEARVDFRKRVLPAAQAQVASQAGAPGQSGVGQPDELEIVELPAVYERSRRQEALAEKLEPLAEHLLAEAEGRRRHKQELVARLGGFVEDTASRIRERLETEILRHERLAVALEKSRKRTRQRLEEFYAAQPFFELDLVFRELMEELEVPYLDRFIGWTGDVMVKAGRLVGLDFSSQGDRNLERQRQARTDAEATVAEEILAEVLEIVETGAGKDAALEVAREAETLTGTGEKSAGTLLNDPEIEREQNALLESMTADLRKRIRERPKLRHLIVGSRAVLIAGGGIAGAVLTGGLGRFDLIFAPASAAVTRKVIEAVGQQYLQQRRRGFFAVKIEHAADRLETLHASILAKLEPKTGRGFLERFDRDRQAFTRAVASCAQEDDSRGG